MRYAKIPKHMHRAWLEDVSGKWILDIMTIPMCDMILKVRGTKWVDVLGMSTLLTHSLKPADYPGFVVSVGFEPCALTRPCDDVIRNPKAHASYTTRWCLRAWDIENQHESNVWYEFEVATSITLCCFISASQFHLSTLEPAEYPGFVVSVGFEPCALSHAMMLSEIPKHMHRTQLDDAWGHGILKTNMNPMCDMNLKLPPL